MKLADSFSRVFYRLRDFDNHPYRKYVPISLAVAIALMVFFAPHEAWHEDLNALRIVNHEIRHPYYAYWLFFLLAIPPEIIAYIGLSITSIAAFYISVFVFEGKHWVIYTSFAFAWTLYYGQIDSIVVGGLALAWFAVKLKRPYLIGLGLIIASIKPQLSLPLILLFWWWSPSRLRSLVIPVLVFGLSLLNWGWWVPEWLQSLGDTGFLVNLSRNLSLWPVIGAWVLLLWPVLFWLPLPRSRKIIAIAAGTAMTMPYFPLPSAVLFLCMPVPVWFYGLAQFPVLIPFVDASIYHAGKILPIVLLIWASWPVFKKYLFKYQFLESRS